MVQLKVEMATGLENRLQFQFLYGTIKRTKKKMGVNT